MTQTLREQVAEAIGNQIQREFISGKHSVPLKDSPSTKDALADAALQALAARIGVSVEGLEHLGEVIEALEELLSVTPIIINGDREALDEAEDKALNVLDKLKGKDNG